MKIYFDNASTTRCTETTIAIAEKFFREEYFNPSASYHDAILVKEAINGARESILKEIGGSNGRLIFTSGGTESDNTAMLGAKLPRGSRIIVSAAEHAAVYYLAAVLRNRGHEVVFAPVDGNGKVITEEFEKLVTPQTSLASIIHVNNETGAINDIAALVACAKRINPALIFVSDGVQAVGKIPLNLRALGIDAYSMSAHKLGCPKGTGALYLKTGFEPTPFLIGGGQESGLRSSTENVAGIVAYGAAVKERYASLCENGKTLKNIRGIILAALDRLDGVRVLNREDGSDYILTFVSDKVRGEVIQHALEARGILVGTGSACASNKASKRIPDALGLKAKESKGLVRLSFFIYNTEEEGRIFASVLPEIYKELSQYGA